MLTQSQKIRCEAARKANPDFKFIVLSGDDTPNKLSPADAARYRESCERAARMSVWGPGAAFYVFVNRSFLDLSKLDLPGPLDDMIEALADWDEFEVAVEQFDAFDALEWSMK